MFDNQCIRRVRGTLCRQGAVLLLGLMWMYSCGKSSSELLVEAESFDQKGGWVVDPQFVEQMGSPYLLAHGMGIPVSDAATQVNFTMAGDYWVWVRTMNWAPGDWEAPGRFTLSVNEKVLETVLGTEEGWSWQRAGKVSVGEGPATITLKDLTGFEGRCDAIYFNTEDKMPPVDIKGLSAWRKSRSGEPEIPRMTQDFDLVITGGGIAGCAASIAAAEQGLKVALIHDRPVLGGNASSEIRVHTEGITGSSDRILSMLNTQWWPNGSPDAAADDQKRMENISRYENITIFLNWRAYAANATNDSITSVDARHTSSGEILRFTAPLFIDCTGDGWIGYWAGAEYSYGREDSTLYHENWDEHKELWSPAQEDNRVMGSSVLWRSYDSGKPSVFPEVPWAMSVAGNYAAVKGEWQWEFSHNDLHQIEDAEAIRDHLWMAIYGSFYNAKKEPGNATLALEWVSYLAGKRESRRLTGDYVYTFNDAREMREFEDAVVVEKRAVDVHYQQNLLDPSRPDFLSEANYYQVDHYYIPYRSLYSKNIKNLLMAGRCFSCSHIGLGGPRVMNTTGQMGVATGYAASLCKKYHTSPRGVYTNHLAELKNLLSAGE